MNQIKYTFTYMCIFAPYSKILTGVNFVHVNGALVYASGRRCLDLSVCKEDAVVAEVAS